MSKIIAIQEHLRPALQPVLGCKDYEDEKRLLERVDLILRHSGVERMFLELCQDQFDVNAAKMEAAGEQAQSGAKAIERYLLHSARALRCTVLKNLVGGSYREISKGLAMSPLYRWFCGSEQFAVIRVPGKSTLRDYAHWLPAQQMEKVLSTLTRAACDEDRARVIGLESELDLSMAWVDTTCLKACIHFPTDWVLLRDAVRTLVKCILTIRRHGFKRRIPQPEEFLRQINALSMGMSAAARRKPGGKRERKRVLRAIKGLSKLVEEHGQRYRDALDKHWSQSDLTRKEAEVNPGFFRRHHSRHQPDPSVICRGCAGVQRLCHQAPCGMDFRPGAGRPRKEETKNIPWFRSLCQRRERRCHARRIACG